LVLPPSLHGVKWKHQNPNQMMQKQLIPTQPNQNFQQDQWPQVTLGKDQAPSRTQMNNSQTLPQSFPTRKTMPKLTMMPTTQNPLPKSKPSMLISLLWMSRKAQKQMSHKESQKLEVFLHHWNHQGFHLWVISWNCPMRHHQI